MADGITIRAQNFRFEGKTFSKVMNREMEGLFTEAARAFLIAAVRRIHIRTGFLRGAFTRLEDVVGAYQLGSKNKSSSSLRPNRDSAVVAHRLIRLRDTQRKIGKRVREIHRREAERRTKLHATLAEKQAEFNTVIDGLKKTHGKEKEALRKQVYVLRREIREAFATNRGEALRDRSEARALLRAASENAKKIDKAVQHFETKLKVKLRSKAADARVATRLRVLEIQQERNEKFQSRLKRVARAYFGYTTTKRVNGGVQRVRIRGKMRGTEYQRRLRKLREQILKPTKVQGALLRRLRQVPDDPKLKAMVERYETKLIAKYKDRLRDAKRREDAETHKELNAEIDRKLSSLAKLVRKQQRADPALLKLIAMHRKAYNAAQADHTDRLNVVARTTRGRIVGQNIPGAFNLRGTERVKKLFNNPDGTRFAEYYYPVKGAPGSKILKTPRSGRRFSTPSQYIITKVTKTPPASLGLLKQLAGIMQQTGRSVAPEVQAAIKDVGETVSYYQFNFTVDIRYLAINDIREAWLSWDAATRAFNQVIASQALKRLPKLDQFMLVETRRLSPTSRSTTISGRR